MAARHLPVPETTWTVTISSNFTVSPQGLVVSQGDQVMFQNNSSYAVVITWVTPVAGQPVYANFTVPANGSAGFQAPNYNVSGNYNVYLNGIPRTGPYGIQVGSGPMYVQVSYNNALGTVTCTPDPVVIPWGNATIGRGTLEMIPGTANTFSVAWQNGDPFNPPLTSVDSQPHTNLAAVGDYPYTITKTGIEAGGGNGGGTVKVKNT